MKGTLEPQELGEKCTGLTAALPLFLNSSGLQFTVSGTLCCLRHQLLKPICWLTNTLIVLAVSSVPGGLQAAPAAPESLAEE